MHAAPQAGIDAARPAPLAKFSAMPSGRQHSAQLVEFFDDSCRAFARDCVNVLNVLSEELTACGGRNVVCDQDDGLRTGP
jgi:hypothetical protein